VTYVLAASAEMLFTELPFVARVRAIHERGLGVEIWNWTATDLDELAATGANFTSMTGYIEGWASGDSNAALDAFIHAFTV
jgi:hydroxypyruvate isomerase